MSLAGITWKGDSIDDIEILAMLPGDLVRILSDINGFILHDGALHVRGACLTPEWHSIRAAWQGAEALCRLYDQVEASDIPFAQDQVGDQFLLRRDVVFRLEAETGELVRFASNLEEFLNGVENNIETFLNVGLTHSMEPGELLLAYPPFCFIESGSGTSLKPLPASEVTRFHANLAKQIRDVPDGGQVEFRLID